MIAQSQSGTGKTAAFVLAMLSRVDPSKPYPQVTGTFDSNALNMGLAHSVRVLGNLQR
jgi:superfamily II DNA/RNA helicase